MTKKKIEVYSDWDAEPNHVFKYPKGYGKAIEKVTVADFKEEGLIVLSV